MRIDPRRRARAFTLLEVVIVFLIIALMMLVLVGLIRSRGRSGLKVPPLPDTPPVMVESSGERRHTQPPAATPTPGDKPGFR